jgi:hypothetical protein
MARAQIARDIVMAQSIRPYLARGVVLLAGNGHVQRDIGVLLWLPAETRRNAISIGILERHDGGTGVSDSDGDFDVYVVTERAERLDPCQEIPRRDRKASAPWGCGSRCELAAECLIVLIDRIALRCGPSPYPYQSVRLGP